MINSSSSSNFGSSSGSNSTSNSGSGSNEKANQSIKCSVDQCKYHCDSQQYCSLDSIMVGTHESNPTQQECTDCESFQTK